MSGARLDGRVALVVGASRGIGRAVALRLAEAGAAVAVAARTERPGRLPGTIHDTAAAITAAGGRALAVRCDITDPEQVEAAVARTVATFGGLDTVVVSAAVLWLAPTLETPVERWRRVVDVDLNGVFIVTRAALPALLDAGRGALIALTTVGVRRTDLGANPYWVAKAGVERYYLGLANELADRDITVACLAPTGVVRTEGWQAAAAHLDVPDDAFEPVADVAEAVLELVAAPATAVTGRVWTSREVLDRAGPWRGS